MERAKGIEPSYAAWEAAVLPLNYARWRSSSTAKRRCPSRALAGLAQGGNRDPICGRLRIADLSGRASMASGNILRFLGGSPASVALRLVALSIVLGLVLSALGLSPIDIAASLRALATRIYASGFDAVIWAWRYFLLGAVIVFPVFLLMRLLRLGRRERFEA